MGTDNSPWGPYDYRTKQFEEDRERARQEKVRNETFWRNHANDMANSQRKRYEATNNSSKSKVICNELRRQRMLTADDLRLCHVDALSRLTPNHMKGYHYWAIPTVRLMRRSALVTRIFRLLAQARVNELAARYGQQHRANIIGRIVIATCEPLCAMLGRFVTPKKYNVLYDENISQIS